MFSLWMSFTKQICEGIQTMRKIIKVCIYSNPKEDAHNNKQIKSIYGQRVKNWQYYALGKHDKSDFVSLLFCVDCMILPYL